MSAGVNRDGMNDEWTQQLRVLFGFKMQDVGGGVTSNNGCANREQSPQGFRRG
jgi:hypothetical protein